MVMKRRIGFKSQFGRELQRSTSRVVIKFATNDQASNGTGPSHCANELETTMMQSNTTRLLQATVAAITFTGFAASAEAGRRGYSGEGGQVVAESRFGNGAIVGSVRQTRLGRQVQTPGGNWLYCKRSCSETLRVSTVDFWQSEQGAGNSATTHEDGLLSPWLHWSR